jgi:hypothetical protein
MQLVVPSSPTTLSGPHELPPAGSPDGSDSQFQDLQLRDPPSQSIALISRGFATRFSQTSFRNGWGAASEEIAREILKRPDPEMLPQAHALWRILEHPQPAGEIDAPTSALLQRFGVLYVLQRIGDSWNRLNSQSSDAQRFLRTADQSLEQYLAPPEAVRSAIEGFSEGIRQPAMQLRMHWDRIEQHSKDQAWQFFQESGMNDLASQIDDFARRFTVEVHDGGVQAAAGALFALYQQLGFLEQHNFPPAYMETNLYRLGRHTEGIRRAYTALKTAEPEFAYKLFARNIIS